MQETAAMPGPEFRFAEEEDVPLILYFIKELAAYQDMSNEVTATEELLRENLFKTRNAEVIFVLDEGKEAGFALFYRTFSTFLGLPGIHLEDLYIRPEYRRKGYGKSLLEELARIVGERGYGRLEWECLDRNRRGIDFYLAFGAEPLSDRTTYRFLPGSLSPDDGRKDPAEHGSETEKKI